MSVLLGLSALAFLWPLGLLFLVVGLLLLCADVCSGSDSAVAWVLQGDASFDEQKPS